MLEYICPECHTKNSVIETVTDVFGNTEIVFKDDNTLLYGKIKGLCSAGNSEVFYTCSECGKEILDSDNKRITSIEDLEDFLKNDDAVLL